MPAHLPIAVLPDRGPRAALDILHRARTLLSDPERWTRAAYARDGSGGDVGACAGIATCWCSSGALRLYGAGKDDPAEQLLCSAARALFGLTPVRVNDELGHGAVLRMYDFAIALARDGLTSPYDPTIGREACVRAERHAADAAAFGTS